jgi:3-deoxy-7-phosphoheptulonate synthase
VILCERGVRTFTDHARNTLDLSIVPAIKRVSHLPILVDPSHGTGRRDSVLPMARAGIAAGADGLMVEVHHQPETALSDGPQSIYPEQFAAMMNQIAQIAPVVERRLPRGIHVAASAG